MHALKLIQTFIKINLQIALAYRVDTAINIFINGMWLVWELFSLSIIFNNTDTLGGWGPGELVALLGVFRLVNMLMAAMIWPATEKFNSSVRDGSLDYTLLMPANSLFLISFARVVLWRIWDLALGVTLVIVGVSMSGGAASLANLLSFMLLVGAGMTVIYSLWVVLISATFWFIKFDNNVTILQALLDSGRYPATIYPPWLRLIVTFVVPIALATTVPLQGLRGELAVWQVLLFLGVGAASFLVASQVWRLGVRRYSGASS
jgi:ABC-2 type transport system permease protein